MDLCPIAAPTLSRVEASRGAKVTPHHVPASTVHHHMENEDVWAMLLVDLHHKAQQLFVKECHSPLVAAWSVQRNITKSRGLLRVHPVSDLGLLK